MFRGTYLFTLVQLHNINMNEFYFSLLPHSISSKYIYIYYLLPANVTKFLFYLFMILAVPTTMTCRVTDHIIFITLASFIIACSFTGTFFELLTITNGLISDYFS